LILSMIRNRHQRTKSRTVEIMGRPTLAINTVCVDTVLSSSSLVGAVEPNTLSVVGGTFFSELDGGV